MSQAFRKGRPPLVLASMSPRRRHLLEQIGLTFDVVPADVDEAILPGEDPRDHVVRLALEKARAGAALRPDAVVIAGDTVVVLDGQVLTKPRDPGDAVAMLLRLQGRTHRVETGVAVVSPDGRDASAAVGTDVRFRAFGRDLAEAYVATREPLDKAGAYGIQGYGSILVDAIDGDYFAVVGLSLVRAVELLEAIGWEFSPGHTA